MLQKDGQIQSTTVAITSTGKVKRPKLYLVALWLGACGSILLSWQKLLHVGHDFDVTFRPLKDIVNDPNEVDQADDALQNLPRNDISHNERALEIIHNRQARLKANEEEGVRTSDRRMSGATLDRRRTTHFSTEKRPTSPHAIIENTNPPPPIKLPFPILVASLYKSGTTTVHSYFECGGQRSVHWETANGTRTGKCMYENIKAGRSDPFEGCGDYDVWTDNSFIRAPTVCWDPSVFDLEAIYQAYPNATLLLTVRHPDSWLHSVVRWGQLLRRLTECQRLWPGHPKDRQLQPSDLSEFYKWQIQHVRDFAKSHPSMTFVEVDLESDKTADVLQERVGIPASCWGHHNVNPKSRGRFDRKFEREMLLRHRYDRTFVREKFLERHRDRHRRPQPSPDVPKIE